ncbi:hypothetical protein KSZ_03170 [Dictyobacter formicarum]|uniref:Ig-like domain-containing protein n=1 Tax=Dictyobacter formicarum TaxID=2778368 RepID=A0ABQ3V9D7_9CHLR|nr:hypothetical protein KSZ_03170 [Dictyobacter formicarum]
MSVSSRSAILAEAHAYTSICGINGLDTSTDMNVTWVCSGENTAEISVAKGWDIDLPEENQSFELGLCLHWRRFCS